MWSFNEGGRLGRFVKQQSLTLVSLLCTLRNKFLLLSNLKVQVDILILSLQKCIITRFERFNNQSSMISR
jgi:hypothetical protein